MYEDTVYERSTRVSIISGNFKLVILTDNRGRDK